MKKLLLAFLFLALSINLYGYDEKMCHHKTRDCKRLEPWFNPAIRALQTRTETIANQINNEYGKVIKQLENEMNKKTQSNNYKPNVNIAMPKFDLNALIKRETGISCCNKNYNNEFRAPAISALSSLIQNYQSSIATLKQSIKDLDFGDNDSDDSGGSSSSGSTSGTTSSGNSSNYNPYGSGGASSSGISSRGSTNEGDFESFRQQVKSGANADNSLVKGNKNKSSSQGDTSFYDVVGERPPSNSGFKDVK